MSKRNSGHVRRKNDLYETPAWVICEGLCIHFNVMGLRISEPCCGPGAMVEALEKMGAIVYPSDIKEYSMRSRVVTKPKFGLRDFLKEPVVGMDAYIINPPYGPQSKTAVAFIEQGIRVLQSPKTPSKAFMAMLLPTDFDCAKSRGHLFEGCSNYRGTIKLRRRIKWFESANKKSGPSEYHSWFIWKKQSRPLHDFPWTLYAPEPMEYMRGTRMVFTSAFPAQEG